MSLAKILLFSYNRPEKLKVCLNSLSNAKLFKDSKIYIFQDGYKNYDCKKFHSCKLILNDFKKKNDNIILSFRERNLGLKNNILKGINESVLNNEKFICIEDDLILSRYFILYMNQKLKLLNDKVAHISAWSPKNITTNNSYYSQIMFCWGWGSSFYHWQNFNDKIINLNELEINNLKIFSYNFSSNLAGQLIRNIKGSLNTWAVWWAYSIYKNKFLCVNPALSYVRNDGFNFSGTNFSKKKINNHNEKFVMNRKEHLNNKFLNSNIQKENDIVRKKLIIFFSRGFVGKVRYVLLNILKFFYLKKIIYRLYD